MSAKPWHKRYHSDALSGMLPLTLEERGAYQTVLDLIYDRGGPIIDNERLLAGYMNCSIRKWRSLREALIAKRKLALVDGHLTNSRAEKEIENEVKTSRKRAENGSKGGRAKAERSENGNENNESDLAGLEQSSSLRARSRSQRLETIPNGMGGAPPSLSERLWTDGLAIVIATGIGERQARGLLGKWRKLSGDAGALALLADAQAQSVSDLVPWMEAAVRKRGAGPPHRETPEERAKREHQEYIQRVYGPNSPRAERERERVPATGGGVE
jgi:uncharacterized protein YdaU (DUF1376 family)